MCMCTRGHQTMMTETSKTINLWGRFVYNMVIYWIAILFIDITFFYWQVFLIVIDKMVSRSRQGFGCLCRILEYLDSNTLQLAYKTFIRPMMKDGNVAVMGASATQLCRLCTIQNIATGLCHTFLFLFSVVVMLPRLDCC